MDYQHVITHVMSDTKSSIGSGQVADYIPDLVKADPNQFGFTIATVDGQVYSVGEVHTPFAIESISKVFALALVLSRKETPIWQRVRREPSGTPFNSLIELEMENGIPRNPYTDPGAIVVADQLLHDTGNGIEAMRTLLRAETGDADLSVDCVTVESEEGAGDRNRAMAYLMASFGNMINPVERALDHYFRQCSITITCEQLAKAGLLVARHGLREDGSRLLHRADARHLVALMTTCGTYDAAGEFAYRIGLPCQSGVGGGILSTVPGKCSVVAWGPGLDAKGNSVAGAAAMASFARTTGFSVF
ncbi:glutaminase [Nocardia sp. NPDC057440]|uniref:glutaminase n=1 Tax=Nocardia sp. NPDC057440 TaxID=3346134 RepID=UPI00366AEBB4